jgi:hypothetical protein
VFGKNDASTTDESDFFSYSGIHQGPMCLLDQVYHKPIANIPMVISGQVKHAHALLCHFHEIRIHWNTNADDSARESAF